MRATGCSVAPASWEILPLDDVCMRITSGGTPSRRAPEFFIGGTIPWVKTQELLDGWIDDTEEHITLDAVKNSSAKILPEQTVLVAMYGATVGQLGMLRRPMSCNQACCAFIVDKSKADFRYLYYQLLNHRHQLKELSTGAAQQNLSGTMLKAYQLPFPKVETQGRIADVLASLDNKIELNRRMNETLEAMARALFRSWFVDFDPVRAKSEGRPTGLPADLEALFPNEFEDSPLGEIPKGWQVQPLGHIADVRFGKTPPRLEHHWFSKSRADVRWVSIRDLGRVDVFISETSEFLTADAVSRFRIRVVPDRTVMVSFKLTVGRVAISDGELTTNEAIAHMIPQDSILAPWFLYSYLGTFDYGRLGSTSSIATAVNSDSIRELPVLVPSTGIVRAFNERVESLFQQILVSSRESRALEDMRCDLLPRLLSGEIEVAEAEVAIA